MDALIQRKVKAESFNDFSTTFIREASTNEGNNSLVGELLEIMRRRTKRASLESSNDPEYDENKYLFSSSDLKFLIDHLLGKSYDIHINFDSLKALCNRTDSLKHRIFLITALLPKTKNNNPHSIDESPVHYVITRNMLNQIDLKKLIEIQAPEFRFLLNAYSFKIISDRKNLDLTRAVVERGTFVPQDKQTPIDILLQERRDYSNQFIRQLIKDRMDNLTRQQHGLNDCRSLKLLVKRNDFKLVELLLFDSSSKITNVQLRTFLTKPKRARNLVRREK